MLIKLSMILTLIEVNASELDRKICDKVDEKTQVCFYLHKDFTFTKCTLTEECTKQDNVKTCNVIRVCESKPTYSNWGH